MANDLVEFAEDVAYQFGYYCQNKGRLHITHGGLSTLEGAFDILGWENPNPVPECECEIDGCHEHATCGTPTKDGYKRVCGKHFNEIQKGGITMDVREKTAGLNYEAEYNRLKEEMAKKNEENTYLREELKNKEKELQYYYGFEAACKLIFGRRYENGC